MVDEDGTFGQLAARLAHPPWSQWAPWHSGCVENKELKISDTEKDTEPIRQRAPRSGDRGQSVVEFRARGYAGYRQEEARTESEGWSTATQCCPASTRRMAVAMWYVDDNNFARFRTEDDETTYDEERLGGVWTPPANVGADRDCDTEWHHWKVVVDGEDNRRYSDGRHVGAHKSSPTLTDREEGLVLVRFLGAETGRARRGSLVQPVG